MTEQVTDYLKEDPVLVIESRKPKFEQKWAVISFVSPEDLIKKRFLYEANRFLYHDVNKQIMDTTTNVVKNLNQGLQKLVEKKAEAYSTSSDPVYKAAAEILKSLQKEMILDEDSEVNKVLRTYKLDQEELSDRFEVYKSSNEKELEADFCRDVTEETSVRGFKIRGGFEDVAQARARAKLARDELEPAISSFVAPIGFWCPWDPSADGIQDQDYMLPELNNLMGQKQRNAEQRDEHFKKRKQMMMEEGGNYKEKNIKDRLKEKLNNTIQHKQNQRLSTDCQRPILSEEEKKAKAKAKEKAKKQRQKQKHKLIEDSNNLVEEPTNEVKVSHDLNQQSLTFEVSK